MKRKKIFNLILGVLIFITTYAYISFIFIPKDIDDYGGDNFFREQGFLGEPLAHSLDIIAFGHSGVYSGFSPVYLYKKYGYTSYASAASHQSIHKINNLLNLAIKKQKPKIVLLDVDCLYNGHAFREYEKFFIPFVYHSRWKTLKLRDFYQKPNLKNHDVTKGYRFSSEVSKFVVKDYMGNIHAKPQKLNKNVDSQLKHFIKKCKNHKIELTFINFANATSWNYGKHNYIQELSKLYHIDFLDMNVANEKYSVDFSKEFRDKGNHYNIYGSTKAMNYIGKYLSYKYSSFLKDKRNDQNYAFWQLAIQDFDMKLQKEGINLDEDFLL